MVARERFELSSAGPEPAMLDRYTTGLQSNQKLKTTNKPNQDLCPCLTLFITIDNKYLLNLSSANL